MERKYPIELLLKYELTDKNHLFDADGLFSKADKSSLNRELEKKVFNIKSKNELDNNNIETALVVDVMLIMRKIPWGKLTNFNDLAEQFCTFVNHNALLQNTKRIDFVFDSYFDTSIKSFEYLRRENSSSLNLYSAITGETLLPKQADKFWNSSKNKIILQIFLRNIILSNPEKFFNRFLVCSTINDMPCSSNTQTDLRSLQRPDLEEADLKLMLHINHAVENGYQNIYLISSDTDVFVLGFYFFQEIS